MSRSESDVLVFRVYRVTHLRFQLAVFISKCQRSGARWPFKDNTKTIFVSTFSENYSVNRLKR